MIPTGPAGGNPWRPFSASLLAMAVVLGTGAWPHRAEPAQQPIRVDVSLVLVDVTVKDKAGKIVGDLTQEDFQVYEDGQPQQIAHFSRDQLPLAVALVVDLSNSVAPFLRPLRYASMTALKSLKREDQVALVTFSSDVELRVELSRDKTSAAREIESLTTGGATNINEGVFEAARYLRDEAPAARRVVVLVSDNVPSARSEADHDDVVEAALEADASVYSLKVPGDNPTFGRGLSKISMTGMVNVSKLAAATGGEVFDVEKEGSLYLSFQKLIERLKTRYTLGYYPTNKANDGKFRKLEVRLAPAQAKDKRTVLAKQGYYAPRLSRSGR